MSTKCTIGHSDAFHLYEECFDSDRVYLRLDGHAVVAEIDTRDKVTHVTVGIDVSIWRQIVEAWVKSHWAQHPDRDHAREEPDFDAFEEMLKALDRNAAKKAEQEPK